jgi:hypothetical protein
VPSSAKTKADAIVGHDHEQVDIGVGRSISAATEPVSRIPARMV